MLLLELEALVLKSQSVWTGYLTLTNVSLEMKAVTLGRDFVIHFKAFGIQETVATPLWKPSTPLFIPGCHPFMSPVVQ